MSSLQVIIQHNSGRAQGPGLPAAQLSQLAAAAICHCQTQLIPGSSRTGRSEVWLGVWGRVVGHQHFFPQPRPHSESEAGLESVRSRGGSGLAGRLGRAREVAGRESTKLINEEEN